MNSRRLPWLLVLLGALLVVRWLVPPNSSTTSRIYEVAQAVPRATPSSDRIAGVAAFQTEAVVRPQIAPRGDERDRPGNAFAARAAKLPPMPVVPPPPAKFVEPPRPAPPPTPTPTPVPAPTPTPVVPVQASPSLRVIGTWDDGGAPGVFLAGPNGTVLARPGNVLLGEYSVATITPQRVTLLHIESKRELLLPIPQVSPTPLRP